MNKIFKVLIIHKIMEAVTANFVKNNQNNPKYTKCAFATLEFNGNLYFKHIFRKSRSLAKALLKKTISKTYFS